MTDRIKCSVRDGRFVEPCKTLASAIDNVALGFSKKKGIFSLTYTNFETGEQSRRMIGVRSDEHKNGLLFNHCPWCGEKIDAPFAEQKAEAA